ncbi:MAG: TIM44-like domain-containing protein [Leptospiraceae bacterium]|nr:TIM44-like domain-containing protein [Leptospiraceae bacterium]
MGYDEGKKVYLLHAIFIIFMLLFNGDQIKAFENSFEGSVKSFIVYWKYGNIFLYLLFGIIFFTYKPSAKKIESETGFDYDSNSVNQIKTSDPNFDPEKFLRNIGSLAEKMNGAWVNNKMSVVRNLISSGVYNRFKIQLGLMKSDKVQNVMSDWFLSNVFLHSFAKDKDYETVHVQIQAYARDANLSTDLSKSEVEKFISSTPQTYYSEIWSFVRKLNAPTREGKNLLEGNCPNCGAPILELGESNQCKYCKSIVNSGEYDWVLAEITQIEEWKTDREEIDLHEIIELSKINPMVSKQIIEDRASYLFWLWVEGRRVGDLSPLSRDISKNFLNYKFKKSSLHDVAVGAVELNSIQQQGDDFLAEVLVLWSAAHQLGANPEHKENKFHLRLPKSITKNSGLSENSCLSCGAPYPDSGTSNCAYCGADVPSTVSDWLLDQVTKVQ